MMTTPTSPLHVIAALPLRSFSKEEAVARAVADHAMLRGLSGALNAAARAASTDEKQRFAVRGLLAQLCEETERHMRFEELILSPLLMDGEQGTLAKDHAEQRSLLMALTEDAEDGSRVTIDMLVDEVMWFVRNFEDDMRAEEVAFSSAHLVETAEAT